MNSPGLILEFSSLLTKLSPSDGVLSDVDGCVNDRVLFKPDGILEDDETALELRLKMEMIYQFSLVYKLIRELPIPFEFFQFL